MLDYKLYITPMHMQ